MRLLQIPISAARTHTHTHTHTCESVFLGVGLRLRLRSQKRQNIAMDETDTSQRMIESDEKILARLPILRRRVQKRNLAVFASYKETKN